MSNLSHLILLVQNSSQHPGYSVEVGFVNCLLNSYTLPFFLDRRTSILPTYPVKVHCPSSSGLVMISLTSQDKWLS